MASQELIAQTANKRNTCLQQALADKALLPVERPESLHNLEYLGLELDGILCATEAASLDAVQAKWADCETAMAQLMTATRQSLNRLAQLPAKRLAERKTAQKRKAKDEEKKQQQAEKRRKCLA